MKKFVIWIGMVVLIAMQSQAQTIRYQNNIRGGFAVATNCLVLKSGTAANTAGGTTNSSYSDLILPAGSTIEKAYLYVEGYAASLLAGTMKKITGLKFKAQGGAYVSLSTASAGFIGNPLESSSSYGQFIIDVTSLVPSNGYVSTLTAGGDAGTTGRYSVADVTPYVTSNYGYGWALFVVYSNPTAKYRSVTIADACNTSSSTIIINNVVVPSSGTINAVAAATGCWGDPGLTDYVKFGKTGTTLTGLVDPVTGAASDALNSTIGFCPQNNVSADGGPAMSGNYTARKPYNTFNSAADGSYFYDLDIMNASGILANSSTPISVTFNQASGGGDALGFGVYAVSIDIAAANIVKSISPTSISTGGTATYTFNLTNTIAGAINLTGIGFTDNLPAGLVVANPSGATLIGGTGGTITATPGATSVSLAGLALSPLQTAVLKVNVTNVPGQYNLDCSTNPSAFTNGFSNIINNTANLANAVTPVCLLVSNVLPVTLTSFTGCFNKNFVELNWSTASEIYSKEFIIEREYNGSFTPIGSLDGAGNSNSVRVYSFVDNNPQQGQNYYRLKQVDFDGETSYSSIISVQTVSQEIAAISTLWEDEVLSLNVEIYDRKSVSVTLIDMNGRRLISQSFNNLGEGAQRITLNTNGVNSGIYFLLLESNGKIAKQIKIVKQ